MFRLLWQKAQKKSRSVPLNPLTDATPIILEKYTFKLRSYDFNFFFFLKEEKS